MQYICFTNVTVCPKKRASLGARHGPRIAHSAHRNAEPRPSAATGASGLVGRSRISDGTRAPPAHGPRRTSTKGHRAQSGRCPWRMEPSVLGSSRRAVIVGAKPARFLVRLRIDLLLSRLAADQNAGTRSAGECAFQAIHAGLAALFLFPLVTQGISRRALQILRFSYI